MPEVSGENKGLQMELAAQKAATGIKLKPEEAIKKWLEVDYREQIEKSLPPGVSLARFTQIALTELKLNPKLAACTPASIIGGIMQASQLGLEIGQTLGLAYLIPYAGIAQLQIGYKGLIALAYREPRVLKLQPGIYREGDQWVEECGSNERFSHIPLFGNQGKVLGYYAYAIIAGADGMKGCVWKVLTVAECEHIRDRFSQGYKYAAQKGSKDNPWISDFDSMAMKSCLKRLHLPKSAEFRAALAVDQTAKSQVSPNMAEEIPPEEGSIEIEWEEIGGEK